MDDFLILGTDKKHLAVQKDRIREFLSGRLKLSLHPKKCEIFLVREPSASNEAGPHTRAIASNGVNTGLDFLGYVLLNGKRRLRKSTVRRFVNREKRHLALLKAGKIIEKQISASRKSWLGYAKFADSWGLRKKLDLGWKRGLIV